MKEYTPHQQVSIDECMVPFKGRLAMKQYYKEKPVKWGIKVWMLADSTNGFCYNFEVYVGKIENEDKNPKLGLASKVVLDLMKPIYHKGYHLYTDRFFTSVTLLYYLQKRGTYACGTTMTNRKFFPRVEVACKDKDLQQGQSDWVMDQDGTGILATIWKDKHLGWVAMFNLS